jgi:hypothetical protein
MKKGEEALQRCKGRRDGVGVVRVEPLLDRLGVPVAEIVEGQVVDRVRDV